MNIKEYVKRVFNDMASLEINSQNFWLMIGLSFFLSLITTPIVGIPLSAMIISQRIQNE